MQSAASNSGIPVSTGSVPAEGRMKIPYVIQLGGGTNPVTVDLTAAVSMAKISNIQTLFIDNSLNPSPLTIVIAADQSLVVPALSQAYLPVLQQSAAVRFTFSSPGNVNIPVEFLNFAIAPTVWSVGSASANTYNVAGQLLVSDPNLLAAFQNGAPVAGAKTYSAGSGAGTITAANTSQVLTAALPGRKNFVLQNTSTAPLYFSWVGASVIGGPQTYTLAPGASYEPSSGMCTAQALTILGGTVGQTFAYTETT